MSVRSIWILSLSKVPETGGRLLFSRHFPTVEKRLSTAQGDDYQRLSNDQEITHSLYTKLCLSEKLIKFDESRDGCDRVDQKPVFEITTSKGNVWPLLILEQYGLLYCCLPYVETTNGVRPPLLHIASLSVCFSLLLSIADFIGPHSANITQTSPKFEDLYLFLSEAAPFGTISDTDVPSVTAKLNIRPTLVSTNSSQIQPSWKPEVHKGKGHLHFTITEHIRAVQYNKLDHPDVWTLYGSVGCKGQLEGVMPDVTINLTHPTIVCTPLDHIHTHPCVQSADAAILQSDAAKSSKAMPRKMRFSPPNEPFTLCHYTAAGLRRLPISGAYHMKMTGRVANLELKLYIDDNVKNLFDYCELQLPFYNRGIIERHDTTCTTGTAALTADRRVLVWSIGQRFPSKSPEITLASMVKFTDPRPPTPKLYDDPFCLGQNAYAQLCFKISDFTLTGVQIDPKMVHVSPATKCKVTTGYSFTSAEYKIWNSHGDVIAAYVPINSPDL